MRIDFPKIVRREYQYDGFFALRCRLFSAWKQVSKLNPTEFKIEWDKINERFVLCRASISKKGTWIPMSALPGPKTIGDYL